MNHLTDFILIILFVIDVTESISVTVCKIGIEGKCLQDNVNRMRANGFPKSDAGVISTIENQDYPSCQNHCNVNIQCFMAGYIERNLTCTLYRNKSYTDSYNSEIVLYFYVCCDTNSRYYVAGRCPGYWTQKVQSTSDNVVRKSDPIEEFKNLNVYQCQMKCLDNPICGAVNFLRTPTINTDIGHCQLIIQFPVEMLEFKNQVNSTTFQWQCASNYTLPSPSRECHYRSEHLRGYWVIQNQSIPLSLSRKYLIYFFTMDYQKCLDNCALYPKCNRAWYSQKSLYCILEGTHGSTCAQKSDDKHYIFTTYIWKDCSLLMSQNLIKESTEFPCRTLINNNYTYIYPITCGSVPNEKSKLHRCWPTPKPPYNKRFSHKLHCQPYQSFRVLPDQVEKKFRVLKDHTESTFPFSNFTWQKVFTGYESFWLVNVSEDNFPLARRSQCEIFDASMEVRGFRPLNILTRQQWFAPKPKGSLNPFPKHPVQNVIISDTEQPFCNCFSIEACSFTMRNIQTLLDTSSLPYSFVVTGDGIAYEGRGFDFAPTIALEPYNDDSLAIALCGRYIHNPDVLALATVKQLIKLAIDKNKVVNNYTLYMYNDLRPKTFPYAGIRRVIALWPRYRGHTNDECSTISDVTICCNMISVVLMFALILVMVHIFIRRNWHNKNCNLVRKCRIETIYSNKFQSSKELLPQILVHNIQDLIKENICISSFTSSFFCIEDYISTIIQTEKSGGCDCLKAISTIFDICRMQNKIVSLSTILLLPEINTCPRTIAFVSQRNVDLGTEYILFLHFGRVTSFVEFLFHLHQNKCLCDNFNLTQYDYQCFVTEFCHVPNSKKSELKRANCRAGLQKQYSFVIDSKNTKRYYFGQ